MLTLPAHQLVYTVENVEYTKGPLQNSFSDYVKNASLTYIWKALTTRNTQDGEK